MIPPSQHPLKLLVHYFPKWFLSPVSPCACFNCSPNAAYSPPGQTSFFTRTNSFESNQIWQDEMREEKQGRVWIIPFLGYRASQGYLRTVSAHSSNQNRNICHEHCMRKPLDHVVTLLHLQHYFARAVFFFFSRNEMQNNVYDYKKTLYTDANDVLLIIAMCLLVVIKMNVFGF